MSAMNLKKCCAKVFSYQTPSKKSDLNNYYTNNYLPYKGAAAWEIQLFVTKVNKI
jgi:hypothetical protein